MCLACPLFPRTCVALQGFYLKLGQILACKTDMLPGPYTESLSRLLDRLPPVPYSAVRRTIRAELGASPEVLFRDVDPFPLASATIAQVRHCIGVSPMPMCRPLWSGHVVLSPVRPRFDILAPCSSSCDGVASMPLGTRHAPT